MVQCQQLLMAISKKTSMYINVLIVTTGITNTALKHVVLSYLEDYSDFVCT